MGIASQSTSQRFPHSVEEVYQAFLRAVELCGFEIDSQDEALGRITAKAGMSTLSFGERLVIRVESDPSGANAVLESSLKIGANLSGAHRHAKNFDALIKQASELLKDPAAVDARLEREKKIEQEESSSVLTLAFLGLVILAIVLFLKFGT